MNWVMPGVGSIPILVSDSVDILGFGAGVSVCEEEPTEIQVALVFVVGARVHRDGNGG